MTTEVLDYTSIEADASLEEARDWLRDRVRDGATCPCCRQFAKVYRRKLPNVAALLLVAMYREDRTAYVAVTPLLNASKTTQASGDGVKAAHWGLIEAMPGAREDGSTRVGWWRLTELGRAFVEGQAVVAKYALLYDNRCLKTEGPPITIREALGNAFNYDELMAA